MQQISRCLSDMGPDPDAPEIIAGLEGAFNEFQGFKGTFFVYLSVCKTMNIGQPKKSLKVNKFRSNWITFKLYEYKKKDSKTPKFHNCPL